MTDNPKLERALERVRSARADYEARQDDVAQARERYYEAVRSLNSTGMSLREVADALGLSHQRVHQMIHEEEPRGSKVSRRVRKASKAGGVVVLVGLLAANVMWLNARRGDPVATPSPTRVASLGETPPNAPDGMVDEGVETGDIRCPSVSAKPLRKAAHHVVTRVWLDRDDGRPLRDVIVDVRARRLNHAADFTYTVEPAGSDC